MDDAHGYEERLDAGEGVQITANGDYLCVQHEGQPRHIYRRVPVGSSIHPLVSRKIHDGELYSLAWIEEDD
jgi:hypothetical protein